ncbi:MAG: phosphoribosylglycinamide formyltransferase, partial [Planctomycetota bacterium]
MGDAVTPVRAVVMVSGSGTTLQNFIDRAADGRCPIDIVGVVASRPDAYGIERAAAAGIPATVVEVDRAEPRNSAAALTAAVDAFEPALVVLAGFNHLWAFPERYANRVMNVHPALLPKHGGHGFYGARVHQAVLAAGDAESGCTVHFCDDEYDKGPIILQRRVPVLPDDTPATLAARVQEAEREAYPEAVALFAAGRLTVTPGGTVAIAPA